MLLVGNDHGSRLELSCLLGQLLITVVGRQTVDFVAVGVLANDIESLRADGAGGTEYGYLFFHSSWIDG